MSLLTRAWQEVQRPLAYAIILVGALLGITAVGMVARGLLAADTVPLSDLLTTLAGAVVLLAVGIGLWWRAPG